MNKEITAIDLQERWETLFEIGMDSNYEEELFEADTFVECVRDTFEYFFSEDEKEHVLTRDEISLYASIYAYSKLPDTMVHESVTDFEKSLLVAQMLAFAILNLDSKDDVLSETVFKDAFWIDDDWIEYEYDVMTDDMGRFV